MEREKSREAENDALNFCLSIRFLIPAFHGRRDRDMPEWPPSPMRVFQSLVAAAAARSHGGFHPRFRSALLWIEKQPAPALVAPAGLATSGYSLSVPNNAMDIVARAWSRGNYSNVGDANPATHRTLKRVRPTLLAGNDAVHYIWRLQESLTKQLQSDLETLREIARSLFALGWGIDVVVANAQVLSGQQADALSGEKWIPADGSSPEGLRVPREGTLDHLCRRHEQFLARLSEEGLRAPMPVSAYRIVEYRTSSSGRARQIAAFSLLKPDASGFRSFNPVQRAPDVAELVRHAAQRCAKRAGWLDEKISMAIMGHGESRSASSHSPVKSGRFAWLPLPSLEARGKGKPSVVGSIRRVIVTSFDDKFDEEIAWTRRALSGEELTSSEENGTATVLLSLLPENDFIVRQYVEPATTWATVTPIVLPGYDDPDHYRKRLKSFEIQTDEQKRLLTRIARRIDSLLRKAIVQSGLSQELASQAELKWRSTGFWPCVDLASRYSVPAHLHRFPRLHVRVSWRDSDRRPVSIPGPICIGGGRFYGLGLFAAFRE